MDLEKAASYIPSWKRAKPVFNIEGAASHVPSWRAAPIIPSLADEHPKPVFVPPLVSGIGPQRTETPLVPRLSRTDQPPRAGLGFRTDLEPKRIDEPPTLTPVIPAQPSRTGGWPPLPPREIWQEPRAPRTGPPPSTTALQELGRSSARALETTPTNVITELLQTPKAAFEVAGKAQDYLMPRGTRIEPPEWANRLSRYAAEVRAGGQEAAQTNYPPAADLPSESDPRKFTDPRWWAARAPESGAQTAIAVALAMNPATAGLSPIFYGLAEGGAAYDDLYRRALAEGKSPADAESIASAAGAIAGTLNAAIGAGGISAITGRGLLEGGAKTALGRGLQGAGAEALTEGIEQNTPGLIGQRMGLKETGFSPMETATAVAMGGLMGAGGGVVTSGTDALLGRRKAEVPAEVPAEIPTVNLARPQRAPTFAREVPRPEAIKTATLADQPAPATAPVEPPIPVEIPQAATPMTPEPPVAAASAKPRRRFTVEDQQRAVAPEPVVPPAEARPEPAQAAVPEQANPPAPISTTGQEPVPGRPEPAQGATPALPEAAQPAAAPAPKKFGRKPKAEPTKQWTVSRIAQRLEEKMPGVPFGNLTKTARALDDSMKSGDISSGILDPANQNARAIFTEITGVRLPRTQKGTEQAFARWFESEKKEGVPNAEQVAEAGPRDADVPVAGGPQVVEELRQEAGPGEGGAGVRPGGQGQEVVPPQGEVAPAPGPEAATPTAPMTPKTFKRKAEAETPPAPKAAGFLRNLSDAERAELEQLSADLGEIPSITKPGKVLSGLDRDRLAKSVRIGSLYVKAGAKNFAEWSDAMVEKLGDWVKDHLDKIWNHPDVVAMRQSAESPETEKAKPFISTPTEPESKAATESPIGQVGDKPLVSSSLAYTKRRRAELGMEERDAQTVRHDEEVIAGAFARLERNPDSPRDLIEAMKRDPSKGMTDEDYALLDIYAVGVDARYEQAANELIRTNKTGTLEEIAMAEAKAKRLYDQSEEIIATIEDPGKEQARAFRFRGVMLKRDYSLARMERNKVVAKGGEPLTPDERAEIKRQHDEIVALTKENEELKTGKEEAEREAAMLRAHQELVKPEPRKFERAARTDPNNPKFGGRNRLFTREAADAARKKFADAFALGAGPTLDPNLIPAAVDLVGYYFEGGLRKIGDVTARMVKDYGEKIRPYVDEAWKEVQKRSAGSRREDIVDRAKKRVSEEEIAPEAMGNIARKLAREFVVEGITEREPLIDAVHAELQKIDPEINRRQTMDAISGYGEYRQLSQEEVEVTLRDLKGQMQQVGKLEDMQARKAPSKTGIERRTPSDEERRLIQQVNEAKRKGGFEVTDPETQLKSSLDAIKTRLTHEIADLEEQIATGEKIVKGKSQVIYDIEANELKARRDALKEQFDQVFGKKELTDEQRIGLAIKAAERSLEDYEKRIAGAKPLFRTKQQTKTISAPELDAIRAKRDAAKAELKLLQDLQDVADPSRKEAISNQAYITRATNRIAELTDKLAKGEFSTPQRKIPVRNAKATQIEFELMKAKRQYHQGLVADRMRRRPLAQKIFDYAIAEPINLYRAIRSSTDLVLLSKHGLLSFAGHPIRTSKTFGKSIKAFRSEKNEFEIEREIWERENAPLYKQAGLDLTETGAELGLKEEPYMSRSSRHIPIVAGSERMFTAHLNLLRANLFDLMIDGAKAEGKLTPERAKVLANFVNAWSGRGGSKHFARTNVVLNTALWAPRLFLSRLQILTGQPMWRGDLVTNKLIAKEYGRAVAGIAAMIGLGIVAGGDIDLSPSSILSGGFGKIRFGKQSFDLLAGLGQITTFAARMISGKRKKMSGEIVPIRGEDVPYGSPDAFDLMADFTRAKFAPAVGLLVDLLSQKDTLGRPMSFGLVAKNGILPLPIQDVVDAMREQNIPMGLALSTLVMLGASLNTMDDREPSLVEQLTEAVRTKSPDATARIDAAIREGKISENQKDQINLDARSTAIEVTAKRSTYNAVLAMYQTAKPEDKKALAQVLVNKRDAETKNWKYGRKGKTPTPLPPDVEAMKLHPKNNSGGFEFTDPSGFGRPGR